MVVRIPPEKRIRRPRQRVTDPFFGLFLLLCALFPFGENFQNHPHGLIIPHPGIQFGKYLF
jgi:hypothetical protein